MDSYEARTSAVALAAAEVLRLLEPYADGSEWYSQAESAVLSVGANWCEGHGRGEETAKAKGAFFRIARASAYEAAWLLALKNEDLAKRMDHIANLVHLSVA